MKKKSLEINAFAAWRSNFKSYHTDEKQCVAKKPNIHMSKSTSNLMGTNCKIHISHPDGRLLLQNIKMFFLQIGPQSDGVQPLLANHLAPKHTLSYTCTHNLCLNFIS